MIIQTMCYADEQWLKSMEEQGTPVYEFDEAWPVTIEVLSQSKAAVEARIIGKGSELGLFIIRCAKGFKIQWREGKLTYSIENFPQFTNAFILELVDSTVNPFEAQTIATAVRKIAEEFKLEN